MTTKMAINAKDIFRNQHRMIKFIAHSIRLCSNQSLKAAQAAQQQQQQKSSVDFEITASVDTQYTHAPEPIKHDKDLGHQFKASQLSVRLATPQQLQPKPDNDEELGFGRLFTDHMLKIYYHKSLGGWQKPEITPLENLVMHPAAKVLHYAVELFEGMKAYRGVDGKIRIFRPDMNMARMNLAAQRSGLPTFEGKEFVQCLSRLLSIDSEWVPHTDTASLYIRPTLIGIDPTLGVASSDSALLYTILSPVGSYFKTGSTGAVSLLADPAYTRAWPGGVGNRKMGSNYAPTINVQKEAASRGLQQVLWLYGEDHQLTEVGTMNIFMFYVNDQGEQELVTPPLNGLILPGITRDSILNMSRQWGKFKVSEANITMPMVCELLNQGRLLELFGAGTACVVSPVNRINYLGQDLYVPTMEQEKPVHELIRETLTDIQYGRVDHPWSVVID
ncbi:branched-chain-amino-acid aminotransferase, cytosolic [Drosophila guanche]|uniref:Branched-chain-amino-acid aminotransferase n=1 Tax=Drosophila guanche TaxID=7266 RepID=A0A3B0JEP8_DROGU|nr:branched-chain-amino-acid aminotransferase, cytosolic [Drosophila guanche]XP_034123672.1 branched-chain-amino-acid aminotransferase, cytosolic [Drosophila guanche]SPP78662.1 blast:Branched-chain-amino-acid aminotransferase [Drosophila guanche]